MKAYQHRKPRPWKVSSHGVFCPYCGGAAQTVGEFLYYQTEYQQEQSDAGVGPARASIEIEYMCDCDEWQRLHNPSPTTTDISTQHEQEKGLD